MKEVIRQRQVFPAKDSCGSNECAGQTCTDEICGAHDCNVVACKLGVQFGTDRPGGTIELPDLVPVETQPLYCLLDSQGNLIVTVRNQGAAVAPPTITRIIFLDAVDPESSIVDRFTQSLGPGEQVDLDPVQIPPVSTTDVNFTITVDFNNVADELNEENNTVSGRCIG